MTSYLQTRFRFRRPGPGSGSYLQTRGAFRQPASEFRDDRIGGEAAPPPVIPATIGLATPTIGATSQQVQTALFTPAPNAMLLTFGTFRRGAVLTAPTCVDTLLNPWTLLATIPSDGGTNHNLSAVWGWIADEAPEPLQVTVRSTSAAVCACEVLQCTGFIDLPVGDDTAVGASLSGDQVATLSPEPDASSWVIGFAAFNGASAAISTPAGFTELAAVFTAGTNLHLHSFVDDTDPAASAAYATGNFELTLILLELRPQ